MMDPDIKSVLYIAFVLWCVIWVFEVGFLIDRWQFWRKTRSHEERRTR